TASGGGWYAAPCAIMFCTCFTFTKPNPATIASVTVSMPIIRFHISSSPNGVDHHAAIHTIAVSRVLSEEARRVVLRSHRDEAGVAADAPAAAAVDPLHAGADVAREERLGLRNPERRGVEDREATDAARRVRRQRRCVREVNDDVAVVVEEIRRLEIRRHA